MTIAIKYALFALLATALNIACQDASLALYAGSNTVVISVLVGTAAGLGLKYYLDKKYIFGVVALDLAQDTRMFLMYTGMGVFTTLVFWGFEFGFDRIFQSKHMRYLGGVIGLAIGYFLKYRLDRRYVFNRQTA